MPNLSLFQSLRNPIFARLYTAQTISLFDDALTWLGLALLAFELAGKDSNFIAINKKRFRFSDRVNWLVLLTVAFAPQVELQGDRIPVHIY